MTADSDYWNRLFRSIRASHEMSKHDVVDCCRHGGIEITGSRAEAWARARRGGTLDRGERRSTAMTEAEFAGFVAGLVTWARGHYDNTGSAN